MFWKRVTLWFFILSAALSAWFLLRIASSLEQIETSTVHTAVTNDLILEKLK